MSETIYERNIRHTALNKRIYYGTLSPEQMLTEGLVSVLVEQVGKKDVEEIKNQTSEIGGLIDKALSVTGNLPAVSSYLTNFKNGLKSSEQIVQAALLGKKPGFFDKLFGKDVSPADALQQVAAINQKASAALVSISNAADTIATALEGNLPDGSDSSTPLKDLNFPEGGAFNTKLLAQGVEKAFTTSSGGIFSKAVKFFKDKIGKLIIPNYKSEDLDVKKTIEEFMSLSLGDLNKISETLNAGAVPEPPSGAVEDINQAANEDGVEPSDAPAVDPQTVDAISKVLKDLEDSGLNQELIDPLRKWMTRTVQDPDFSKLVQQESFLSGNLADLLFEQEDREIKFSDLTKIFKKNAVNPFTKLKDKAFEFMADVFASALEDSGVSVTGDPEGNPSDDEEQIEDLEADADVAEEDPNSEEEPEAEPEGEPEDEPEAEPEDEPDADPESEPEDEPDAEPESDPGGDEEVEAGISRDEAEEIDAEAEELASQIGDGPISKRELTAILKSMPDITGQGQKAKRARRKFRKAVNAAAGKEVFEESIFQQFEEDQKFLNECAGDPIEKWRKLAGLE